MCNQSCFLTGRNARESYDNFMNWLESVYKDAKLPNAGLVNALKCPNKVKGCFHHHHLSGEEAHEFVKLIQVTLMTWSVQCSLRDMSAGSLLQSTASGRGQITFVAQAVVV